MPQDKATKATATATTQEETTVPDSNQPAMDRKSLRSVILELTPARDAVLLSIEDEYVEIASVEIDPEHGKGRRKYPLTTVTLADGRTFQVAGSGVANVLQDVQPEEYPLWGTFRRLPSDFKPGEYYWIVE